MAALPNTQVELTSEAPRPAVSPQLYVRVKSGQPWMNNKRRLLDHEYIGVDNASATTVTNYMLVPALDVHSAVFEPVDDKQAFLEKIIAELEGLKKEVTELKLDNAALKLDNAALKNEVAQLKQDNAALKNDVARLKESNRMLALTRGGQQQ